MLLLWRSECREPPFGTKLGNLTRRAGSGNAALKPPGVIMDRNRLAEETSPYLLQHKDNPVHWQPWGADALVAAKSQYKPILLSTGYAALHCCHVIAPESFENPAISAPMKE